MEKRGNLKRRREILLSRKILRFVRPNAGRVTAAAWRAE